jgi:hypothetical protein
MKIEIDPHISGDNVEYVVHHYHPTLSYYNYYSSKLKAYFEAINPRYWKCTTTVYAYHKPKPVDPSKFESYT